MRRIASSISQMNGEGALAVFSRAKELEKLGRSIIHLELGEPDFHPAAPIVDAVRAAVAEGRDRYVSSRGIPQLREAIAAYLQRTRRLQVAAGRWIVLSFLGSPANPQVAEELSSLLCQADLLDEDRLVFYGVLTAPPGDPALYLNLS